MKLLFDADVLLDLLLRREPHARATAELLSLVDTGPTTGCCCATAVTTIHYLDQKLVGPANARQHIQMLLSLLDVAPVNRLVLESALTLGFGDFEDAVTHEAARQAGVAGIITRNVRDYRRATIVVSDLASVSVLRDALFKARKHELKEGTQ